MNIYRQFVFFLLISTLFGCSSVQVSQDYDQAEDFSIFKTYDWQIVTSEAGDDPRGTNSLIEARIQKAVDRILTEKGFRKVTDKKADLHVSYIYKLERRFEPASSSGVEFGIGTFGSHGGVSIGQSIGSDYDQSIIVIDFIKASSGQLVWRGIGSWRAFLHSDPEQITKSINSSVEEILSQFPPEINK